jgi:hypothetical protein
MYCAEAILPTDIKFGSTRVETFYEEKSEEMQKTEINLLEEVREEALFR